MGIGEHASGRQRLRRAEGRSLNGREQEMVTNPVEDLSRPRASGLEACRRAAPACRAAGGRAIGSRRAFRNDRVRVRHAVPTR